MNIGEIFIDAVDRADYKIFNEMLSVEIVNSIDKYGNTALHYAAINGNEVLTARLIESGANVNAKNIYGHNPLVETIVSIASDDLPFYNNEESIILLVQSGATSDGILDLYKDFEGNDEGINILNDAREFIASIKVIKNSESSMDINITTDSGATSNEDDTTLIISAEPSQRLDDSSSSNDGEPSQKIAKHSHNTDNNNGASQRSSSIILNNEDTSNNSYNNQEQIAIAEKSSLLDLVLKEIYSWIEALPEWLQEQKLESTPIQVSIEDAKQRAAIYDKKYVEQDLIKIISPDLISFNATERPENNIDQQAKMAEHKLSTEVDTTLTSHEQTIDGLYGLILPTMIEGLPSSGFAFNDEAINFNGLNGL